MPGTWIFVGASFGMLVDSIGEKLRAREHERRSEGRRQDGRSLTARG